MTKDELLQAMEPYKGREYRRHGNIQARFSVEGKIHKALVDGDITEEWVESIQGEYKPLFGYYHNVLTRYRMRKNGAKIIV